MNQTIQIYTIPKNPNIIKGHIYTLYISNNNNIDLSQIISLTKLSPKTVTITEENYNRLLELNNLEYQLTNKHNIEIQNFLKKESKNINELTNISNEKQLLIKNIIKEKEKK